MLEFYDRNRIATWVRDHPGLILWVRERIGKAVPGWQTFGAWSHVPAGVEASYLADEQARLRTGDKNEGDGISAVEGINRIRKVLNTPGHVVRLVGLSGVGKTRLAEALFDPAVGEGALDQSLAIYTNEADGPNPPPAGLASDLIAGQTRAILVVDNCTPELHRKLSEVARSGGSTISVISIEYDIREDQPEGTDVFALETSSIVLIEKLVSRRYPDLSQIDAHTIARFSDGNARVALALASRIEKTESVAALSEEELFKRLFQQRHDPDPALLSIAQACSLVYSFEGEKLEGDEAELPFLGCLIGKSADEVYAGVAELRRRDLVRPARNGAPCCRTRSLTGSPSWRCRTFLRRGSGRLWSRTRLSECCVPSRGALAISTTARKPRRLSVPGWLQAGCSATSQTSMNSVVRCSPTSLPSRLRWCFRLWKELYPAPMKQHSAAARVSCGFCAPSPTRLDSSNAF